MGFCVVLLRFLMELVNDYTSPDALVLRAQALHNLLQLIADAPATMAKKWTIPFDIPSRKSLQSGRMLQVASMLHQLHWVPGGVPTQFPGIFRQPRSFTREESLLMFGQTFGLENPDPSLFGRHEISALRQILVHSRLCMEHPGDPERFNDMLRWHQTVNRRLPFLYDTGILVRSVSIVRLINVDGFQGHTVSVSARNPRS